MMAEYGAVQMARSGVVLPPAAMFGSEEELVGEQSRVAVSSKELVLQTQAADALAGARAEARRYGVKISPRGPESDAQLLSSASPDLTSRGSLRVPVRDGSNTPTKQESFSGDSCLSFFERPVQPGKVPRLSTSLGTQLRGRVKLSTTEDHF